MKSTGLSLAHHSTRTSRVLVSIIALLTLPLVRAGRLAFGAARHSLLLHEAFVKRPSLYHRSKLLQRIRGGAIATELEKDSDEESEELDLDEEAEADDEEEADEEEDEGSSDDPLDESQQISKQPMSMTVKTNTGNRILDQSIELTVNRSRNVASIKESLRRQLPGRPPVEAMQLVHDGRRLPDETLVNDLIDEDEEEDEEEEASSGLVLFLDMIPPVDPKFVPILDQKMQDFTASQLLDAYAANEAAMYQNGALLMESSGGIGDEDDEEEVEHLSPLLSVKIRENASRIRQDLEETLLHTEHAQKLLADPLAPSAQQQSSLQATQVRGKRVRQTAVSGVRTTLRRKVQHNLNIQWAESIRYFCLFIFFGWFGGRTPVSRAILLLGAPSVFVLQARPVKLWIKQVMYALLDHPPSIFLSLLPAPQQTILSLDESSAMKTVYGEFATVPTVGYESEEDDDLSASIALNDDQLAESYEDEEDSEYDESDEDEEEED